MADVALRGIPDSLHRELKAAAKRDHRSLNGEILARLAASLRPAPVDAIGLLERIGRRYRTLGPLELDEAALRRHRAEAPGQEGRRHGRAASDEPSRGGRKRTGEVLANMIVVDTSAMVRLVMGGPDGEGAARLLLRDPEWAAPPVLLSELRNVLLGLVRQGSLILDQARAMCDDAARVLGPRIVTVSSDRALDAALACGMNAADAEFVVLARELGVRLATADRSILKAARELAIWAG